MRQGKLNWYKIRKPKKKQPKRFLFTSAIQKYIFISNCNEFFPLHKHVKTIRYGGLKTARLEGPICSPLSLTFNKTKSKVRQRFKKRKKENINNFSTSAAHIKTTLQQFSADNTSTERRKLFWFASEFHEVFARGWSLVDEKQQFWVISNYPRLFWGCFFFSFYRKMISDKLL